MINLLLLNHFYPVMSYEKSSKEKESDEWLYIWFGHSLWSAIQLPAQAVDPSLYYHETGNFRRRHDQSLETNALSREKQWSEESRGNLHLLCLISIVVIFPAVSRAASSCSHFLLCLNVADVAACGQTPLFMVISRSNSFRWKRAILTRQA